MLNIALTNDLFKHTGEKKTLGECQIPYKDKDNSWICGTTCQTLARLTTKYHWFVFKAHFMFWFEKQAAPQNPVAKSTSINLSTSDYLVLGLPKYFWLDFWDTYRKDKWVGVSIILLAWGKSTSSLSHGNFPFLPAASLAFTCSLLSILSLLQWAVLGAARGWKQVVTVYLLASSCLRQQRIASLVGGCSVPKGKELIRRRHK